MSHVWANLEQVLWHVLALGLLAVTVVEYRRRRTSHHRDAVVLFATLGLVAVSEMYRLYLHGENQVLLRGFDLGLVVHPYAMVRVVDHVRPLPRSVEAGAGTGAVAGVSAVLVYGSLEALPTVVFEGLLVYFVGVVAYLTVVLVTSADRSRGPIRKRLILAASGAFSLVLAAIVFGTVALVPEAPEVLTVLDDLLLAGTFLNYYLGFSTPEPLARWWHSAELRHFLAMSRADDPGSRLDQATRDMCVAADRLLDAEEILYLEPSNDGSLEIRHRLRAGTDPGPLAADGLAGTALAKDDTRWASHLGELADGEKALAQALGASVAIAVPLEAHDRRFGVVLAFLQRRPLFAEGAVVCLELIADEVALLQEQEIIIEEREAERRRVLEAEKEAAQESERLKDEFLATMSHEIRTPMNSVIGIANLLQDADLDEADAELVDILETSGTHLLTIIDDILDLSKIEAGRLRLSEEPVEVRDLVGATVALVGPGSKGKDLHLEWSVGDDVPEAVVVDPHRLRQILLNLLSNAVKFTDEGRVELRVIATGSPEDVELRFEVEDSGPGMSPEEQAGLFQAFQQADSSSTRRHEGTGLGLKISRELVELMGGTIGVDSEEGKGSTFWFTVPTEAVDPPEDAPLPEAGSIGGRSVLVVGDPGGDLPVVAQTLEEIGAHVGTARSADEALERVRGDLDLEAAVVDSGLQRPGGGLLVEAIRGVREDLAIVLLANQEHPPGAGAADATLMRPVEEWELLEALLLGLRSREAQTVAEGGPPRNLAAEHPLDILIVEDNPVNRTVIQKMLGTMGYDPSMAVDGEEGVERIRTNRYDLVLMDVQMPNLDGLGATRHVRNGLPPDRQPRIVGLSAHAGAERAAEAREAGMDAYLEKPLEPEELRAVLEATDARG